MTGSSSLGHYDTGKLAELADELDKRFKSGDITGVQQLIKICCRVETSKESINDSKLGRKLFVLAKDWKMSD